jgi:rhodanese-related sulfurtransferase
MKPENNLKWEQAIEMYGKEKEKICLLDCRPEAQFNIVNLAPFFNVPMEIMQKMTKKEMDEMIKDKKTFIMCRRGNWSRTAVKLLLENSFESK